MDEGNLNAVSFTRDRELFGLLEAQLKVRYWSRVGLRIHPNQCRPSKRVLGGLRRQIAVHSSTGAYATDEKAVTAIHRLSVYACVN